MYAQVEKPKERNSKAVANSIYQRKVMGEQCVALLDNRRATIQKQKSSLISDTFVNKPTSKISGRNFFGVSQHEKYTSDQMKSIPGFPYPTIQLEKIKTKTPGYTPISKNRRRLVLDGNSVNVEDGTYNFASNDGEIYVLKGEGHPGIFGNKPVDYAGVLIVQDGELRGWNNGSGHYTPDESLRQQANLPDSLFETHENWYSSGKWAFQNESQLVPSTKEKIEFGKGISIPIIDYDEADDVGLLSDNRTNSSVFDCLKGRCAIQ